MKVVDSNTSCSSTGTHHQYYDFMQYGNKSVHVHVQVCAHMCMCVCVCGWVYWKDQQDVETQNKEQYY